MIMHVFGWVTIVVSIIGVCVYCRHIIYLMHSRKKSVRLAKQVFITDIMIYIVTVFFGFAVAVVDEHHWIFQVAYISRPFILAGNIMAFDRLMRHMVKG